MNLRGTTLSQFIILTFDLRGVDHSLGNLFLLGNYVVTLPDVEKEYGFSLIKAGVSLHRVGPDFPWSIGIDAVRLSAGNSKPRPSERRPEYEQGGAEIQELRARAFARTRQHQHAGRSGRQHHGASG